MASVIDGRTRKLAENVISVARTPHDTIVSNGRGGFLDRMLTGTALSFDTQGWEPGQRERVAGDFHLAATFRLWDRNRIFYAAHPQFVQYMAKIKSTPIPGEAWMLIPHTEPLVLLPGAAPIVLPTGETGTPAAFFVQGRRWNSSLCPIHEDHRVALGITFLVRLANGEHDVIRTTVDTTKPMTLAGMVADSLTRFHAVDGPPPTDERWNAYLTSLMRTAMSLLLYSCCDEPDITTMPLARGRSASRRPKAKGAFYALGWHDGPALHSSRQARRDYEPTGGSGGWRQPHHQRGASIRTYWTDEGRTIPRLRFVKPYDVSKDLLPGPEERTYRVLPMGSG